MPTWSELTAPLASHSSASRTLTAASDPRPSRLLKPLSETRSKVRCVEFAPNGSHLVSIADNPDQRPSYVANLWERSGRRVAVLDAPDLQSTRPVLFGEAGTFVCLEGDSAVRVFDLDGRQIGVLGGPRGTGPESVAVSPNGRDVAACFSDGVVRIWNLEERRRTMTFDIGQSGAIIFSPDGRRLLHATPVGRIEQHALDVADLFASAAARAGRGFTEDELARFGIQQPVKTRHRKLRLMAPQISSRNRLIRAMPPAGIEPAHAV